MSEPPPHPTLPPRAPSLWRQTIEPHQIDEEEDGTTPLGGWLLLVLLGLALSVLIWGYGIVQSLQIFARPGIWARLTTPGYVSYHPLWGPFIIYELAGQSFLLVFACVLLWLMFEQRRSFPIAMVAFLINLLVFPLGDAALGGLIPAIRVHQNALIFAPLLRNAIYAAIWLPYMLSSVRVKATFVH